ncbi:MAG TPA: hypothetical protein DCE18_17265 [Syntrophobacteraceae bacterium]|nr:hypothetical protein [Syntrophobacteraceae bacterium]
MTVMKFRYALSLMLLLIASDLSYIFADENVRSYRQSNLGGSDLKILDDLTSSDSKKVPSPARNILNPPRSIPSPKRSNDYGIDFRIITNQELLRLRDKDPDLTLSRAWEILARINVRASYHIYQDIQNGTPIKVPNDFTAYKNWSPLPREIPGFESFQKAILIVKDIPFLGWYESGNLVGDSVVCIGKEAPWTKVGLFRVLDKDIDHVSRSYPNIIGEPAPMPYGLRVYDHVWIHGGDIPRGNCSHGCINLPLRIAEDLFQWADRSTAVLILKSLDELDRYLRNAPVHPSRIAQDQNRRSQKQMPAQMVTGGLEEEDSSVE